MARPSGAKLLIGALVVLGVVAPLVPAADDPVAAGSPTYAYPVPGGGHNRSHPGYPAADIFKRCGALVVAPAAGRVWHLRRVDRWRRRVDNPATRGGLSLAIVDADGVRHYLAHFARIRGDLDLGDRVVAGQRLGRMGSTGRASGCHTHYGLSPPAPSPTGGCVEASCGRSGSCAIGATAS